jgi:transcriptional regulator with XRE-family HTH domain
MSWAKRHFTDHDSRITPRWRVSWEKACQIWRYLHSTTTVLRHLSPMTRHPLDFRERFTPGWRVAQRDTRQRRYPPRQSVVARRSLRLLARQRTVSPRKALLVLVPFHTNPRQLLGRMYLATGASQEVVARVAGVSPRTVSRWTGGESSPGLQAFRALAGLTHPTDAALAAELAAAGGATLETLGLAAPAPPPAVAAPPPPPAPPPLPTRLLAEAVVCAAAEELDTPPRAVRGILRAAFRRAREMHLSVEAMDDALTPPPPAPPPTPKAGSGRGSKQST